MRPRSPPICGTATCPSRLDLPRRFEIVAGLHTELRCVVAGGDDTLLGRRGPGARWQAQSFPRQRARIIARVRGACARCGARSARVRRTARCVPLGRHRFVTGHCADAGERARKREDVHDRVRGRALRRIGTGARSCPPTGYAAYRDVLHDAGGARHRPRAAAVLR